MTTDFRALCAELVDSVEVLLALQPAEARTLLRTEDRLSRARAALADEPAAGEPAAVAERPSVEELGLIYHDFCRGCEFMDQVGFEDAARAVLTRWGNPAPVPPTEGEVAESVEWLMVTAGGEGSFGRVRSTRAVLAPWGNPAPQPPADGEVAKLVARLLDMQTVPTLEERRLAADLLQRLNPPQPVLVSERLPGPEDCTAEGRCWVGYSFTQDELDDCAVDDIALHAWEFRQPLPSDRGSWLPAHALPLPGQEAI